MWNPPHLLRTGCSARTLLPKESYLRRVPRYLGILWSGILAGLEARLRRKVHEEIKGTIRGKVSDKRIRYDRNIIIGYLICLSGFRYWNTCLNKINFLVHPLIVELNFNIELIIKINKIAIN